MSPVRTADVKLLVVEAKTGDAAEELALRHTVQRTLGVDDQGSPWRVERLFRATGPETTNLDRYFRVSGSVDAPSHRFEQAAFELAYRLSDATGFHVEPDLPSSSFAPPEPDFTEASEAEVHLPGSESHDWALDAIRCREAWQLPLEPGGISQGESTIIAHPDTGYTHHRDARADTFDLRRDGDSVRQARPLRSGARQNVQRTARSLEDLHVRRDRQRIPYRIIRRHRGHL